MSLTETPKYNNTLDIPPNDIQLLAIHVAIVHVHAHRDRCRVHGTCVLHGEHNEPREATRAKRGACNSAHETYPRSRFISRLLLHLLGRLKLLGLLDRLLDLGPLLPDAVALLAQELQAANDLCTHLVREERVAGRAPRLVQHLDVVVLPICDRDDERVLDTRLRPTRETGE